MNKKIYLILRSIFTILQGMNVMIRNMRGCALCHGPRTSPMATVNLELQIDNEVISQVPREICNPCAVRVIKDMARRYPAQRSFKHFRYSIRTDLIFMEDEL